MVLVLFKTPKLRKKIRELMKKMYTPKHIAQVLYTVSIYEINFRLQKKKKRKKEIEESLLKLLEILESLKYLYVLYLFMNSS